MNQYIKTVARASLILFRLFLKTSSASWLKEEFETKRKMFFATPLVIFSYSVNNSSIFLCISKCIFQIYMLLTWLSLSHGLMCQKLLTILWRLYLIFLHISNKELLKKQNSYKTSTNSRVLISNQPFKQAFLCQECSFEHKFQLPKNVEWF